MTVQPSSLPTEWLIEELPHLYRKRPDLLHPLLNKLLKENTELRWILVVWAYQEQRINLGKAAELLGVHELELRDQFISLGIPLRLGSATISEARAEVEAVRAWYDDGTSAE
jgi:predicted HTH domain antitoxin